MNGVALVEIDKNGFGSFNFCAVDTDIDYRVSKEEKDKIDFSLSGEDDCDPGSGRS